MTSWCNLNSFPFKASFLKFLPYPSPFLIPEPLHIPLHSLCFLLLWVPHSLFPPQRQATLPKPVKGKRKEGRKGHWAKMEAWSPERLTRTRGESHPPSVKVALPAVFIMHRFSYPSSLEPLRSSGCGCFSKLSFTPSSLAPCSS